MNTLCFDNVKWGFPLLEKCGIIIAGKSAEQIFTASLSCALRSCIIDGFAKTKEIQKVYDFLEKEEQCSK